MLKIMNLPLLIQWEKFKPGTSFFVPCIDRSLTERFVTTEARRLQINVICKHVIEKGKYGVRVWRIDGILEPHYTPIVS
jgi:hypothetical protein